MSEWDFEEFGGDQSKGSRNILSNQWDIVMTVVTFFAVTLVSFLMAWLTKDIPSRPLWMLGLCFAAPVTALLLSAFAKEKVSSSMTPSTSRKAQMGLVCCSILVAFVVGCFCQVTNEKADTYEQVVVGERLPRFGIGFYWLHPTIMAGFKGFVDGHVSVFIGEFDC